MRKTDVGLVLTAAMVISTGVAGLFADYQCRAWLAKEPQADADPVGDEPCEACERLKAEFEDKPWEIFGTTEQKPVFETVTASPPTRKYAVDPTATIDELQTRLGKLRTQQYPQHDPNKCTTCIMRRIQILEELRDK